MTKLQEVSDRPMIQAKIADVARSVNGRDEGKLFFVIAVDGEYVMLADGRGRRIEKPKRKKLKHTEIIGDVESRTAEKLRCGEKVTNADLRRGLSALTGGNEETEGGMQVG